ncbi:MAG TPA: DUF4112 domain-containing protein [Thermoanaerobaculia bacterium]|nr:DUF4112 domain-containing protein [Thermoanaerobaculia bacterium]
MPSGKLHIPEVIEPDSKLPRDLLALRNLATLLDEAIAIPGTGRKIGLDAGLGLIPGVGDAIGACFSAWIVIGALRHRVPPRKVIRMLVNILIDLGVGAIPVIGDVFDFFFEENMMNMRILMEYRDRARPPRSGAAMAAAAAGIALAVGAVSVLSVVAAIAALFWLAGHR